MKRNIFIVVMAAVAMLVTSCKKENLEPELQKMPITLTAVYGGDNAKVNYTESGNAVNAAWDANDTILMVYAGRVDTLTITTGVGAASATFNGTFWYTNAPTANSLLECYVKDARNRTALTVTEDGNVIYTNDAFLNQDGTVAGAGRCNIYYGMTTYGTGMNLKCNFAVNTSILKFTFKSLGITSPTAATVTYKNGSNTLAYASFTADADEEVVYLGVPPGQRNGSQTLEFTCGSNSYTFTLGTRANFVTGHIYHRTIDMKLMEPLTFEATEANTTVTYNPTSSYRAIQYSTDGSHWSDYSASITLAAQGDKVYFRSSTAVYVNSYFTCDKPCYVYGNIMSLVDSTSYATANTVQYGAFSCLFCIRGQYGNDYTPNPNILSHPTKELYLPATNLGTSCYTRMFQGCTGLTRAPELPATTMATYCYDLMFAGCTGLTTAPALPATTLANGCYQYMFEDCTGLTTAPALPATTLVNNCYENMFDGCTSLTAAPELPATTLAYHCYYGMFSGCTGLTTASELPATTLADGCYQAMYIRCSSLTTAPTILPATTLTTSCYNQMFQLCTNLATAPYLPAETLVSNCYNLMFAQCSNLTSIRCAATSGMGGSTTGNWLLNPSASGTFYRPASAASSWSHGPSGIPSGWTEVNL